MTYSEIACNFKFSNSTISRADCSQASSFTIGAIPASKASCQRPAQRHQHSPGVNPGKLYSGIGVLKSLPICLLKARNSSVITAQITWRPWSFPSVWQVPFLYHPVLFSRQHGTRGVPKTLRGPIALMGAIMI